jgi:hypothetical protein
LVSWGRKMKVSKRQLRRIIQEEKVKLQELDQVEYQSDEWHQAMDELREGLVNVVTAAMDVGLLDDDLNDAWAGTKLMIRDMLDASGEF